MLICRGVKGVPVVSRFKFFVQRFVANLFVEDDENEEVLYPHRLVPGYYVSLVQNKVYSIKSGKLKELKKSTWKGKTTVTMSHKGKAHYQNMEPARLKQFVSRNPRNTIKLPIVKD